MTDDHRTTERFYNLTTAATEGVSATLVVIRGEPFGKSFELSLKPVTIGRSNACDLQFGEESVSRKQCEIAYDGESYYITDLQSTNRTQVNGDDITRCQLKDGDRIAFGGVVLKFVASDAVEAAYHSNMYARASSDPLTGIANRRVFDQALDQAVRSQHTTPSGLCLAMLDLDRFKDVNDRYDHLVGDQVLKKVTGVLNRQRGEGELIARLGGEEFAIMLPGLSLREAFGKMESLRHTIARAPQLIEDHEITITISVGVAEFSSRIRNQQALLRAADQALIEAKAAGRNCVRMAESQPV
ncbi:MAG: GGDEF domain-containing protein [Pseudomonadota bacterium]